MPCQRCRNDQVLHQLLAPATDTIPARLEAFQKALLDVERPDHVAAWLAKPPVRDLLTSIGRHQQPISHELLDELPAGKTLHHLRAVLVASGALPVRDEVLARLEQWTTQVIARRHPAQRRILHGYAVWHLLRRLRQRLGDRPATTHQEWNIRTHLTAAISLLDHLDQQRTTLAGCTQRELDEFLAGASDAARAAAFVRWASRNRHAPPLHAPATRWTGPSGPYDADQRWQTARRLLHDATIATADRVAGLLLLLYAQHVNTIARLSVEHVHRDEAGLHLRLASTPIRLPTPLENLMDELVTSRRGSSVLDAPGSWLFPGRLPGQPISTSQLALRLRKLGVQPHQDRNTALFALATEVPSAVLARMLGIHVSVAVQWQQAAGGDWTSYAADVANRPHTTTPSPNDPAEPQR